MTAAVATLTRLEKTAADNGFDRELPRQGDWLGFASTHAPLQLWLAATGEGPLAVAFSMANVARALGGDSPAAALTLPRGACAACVVPDIPSLHRLVRRAFQLSKTLPDALLRDFTERTASLPRSTEVERLVVQRVGQDIFRAGLLEYWEGKCAVTGLAVPELLRASHIKPWADCGTDAERLDVYNGLLLAPHLDAAFDRALVTFADDGALLMSDALSGADRAALGLSTSMRIPALAEEHRRYLAWHRGVLFRKKARSGG